MPKEGDILIQKLQQAVNTLLEQQRIYEAFIALPYANWLSLLNYPEYLYWIEYIRGNLN